MLDKFDAHIERKKIMTVFDFIIRLNRNAKVTIKDVMTKETLIETDTPDRINAFVDYDDNVNRIAFQGKVCNIGINQTSGELVLYIVFER